MKRISILSILLISLHGLYAGNRRHIDHGWEFIRQDMAGAWEVFRPVAANKPESVPLWKEITLPHCWNATDAVAPGENYYQGAGWYRTYLNISNPYADGRTILEFAGTGQRADVYVYTKKVGTHIGGYDKWTVDITDAVKEFSQTDEYHTRYKGRIPIAVRCDNSRDTELIPSDMSDFCLYGGIYRRVSLIYEPHTYIGNLNVSTTENRISIAAGINGAKASATVSVSIISPENKIVYQTQHTSGSDTFILDNIRIRHPKIWDVDTPQLYTCRMTIIADGDTTDCERKFGFRTYEFREHGPFYLNGRRLLLQGTHRHEDHAGVGAAMTDDMIRHEMLQIKAMGANFIRLGHYQQSDLVLDLCDSLGILVWEEIPWCRGGLGGERYRQQARRMLTNMISQHRSHPSIVLWGLGNENDWPGDFPTFEKDSIRAFMNELNTLAHSLDNTRMTSIRRCDFCSDVVDVYSPTIWAGWYSASFHDYRRMEQKAIDRYPRMFHAEWGGDSHAGRFAEGDYAEMKQGDKYGDWSESYIVRLFDWTLHEQLTMPQLTGAAFWTFKDFATPLRPDNPIPYVNQKGVVERDGTPKESFYVFQSYWSKQPMAHIMGHSWWARHGKDGDAKEVLVYSNCKEVELFVNGISYGRLRRDDSKYPAAGLRWEVPFHEGNNHLRAVGYNGKTTVIDETTQWLQIAQWDKPAAVNLSYSDGVVTAVITDANGIPCLDSTKRLHFSIAGDGCLLENQGTATGSNDIQASTGRVRIRLTTNGKCVVAASSPGLQTGFIEINNQN